MSVDTRTLRASAGLAFAAAVGCQSAAPPERGPVDPIASQAESSSRPIGKYFGRVVAAVGDFDGDGVGDYAIGLASVEERRGAVRFYSGRTGEAVFDIVGEKPFDGLGSGGIRRLADVDGDAIDDVAIGHCPGGAPAEIVSVGRRQRIGRVSAHATDLVTGPDFDNDGTRELLRCGGERCAAFRTERGSPALDPRTGAGMETVDGTYSGEHERLPAKDRRERPQWMAVLSDSPRAPSLLLGIDETASTLEVFDTALGLDQPRAIMPCTAREAVLFTEARLLGTDAALGLADFDLDGIPDLLVLRRVEDGLTDTAHYSIRLTAIGSKKRQALFDAAWESGLDAPPSQFNSLALPGDLDRDGTTDIVIGSPIAPSFNEGSVRALSGRNGRTLWELAPPPGIYGLGTGVDALDDLDGDGARELLVGCGTFSYDQIEDGGGVVLVLSGRTGSELRRHVEEDQPWSLR